MVPKEAPPPLLTLASHQPLGSNLVGKRTGEVISNQSVGSDESIKGRDYPGDLDGFYDCVEKFLGAKDLVVFGEPIKCGRWDRSYGVETDRDHHSRSGKVPHQGVPVVHQDTRTTLGTDARVETPPSSSVRQLEERDQVTGEGRKPSALINDAHPAPNRC